MPLVFDPATSQEVQEFPETISGYYRVEGWQRRTPKQYLQFVVILWGADTHPEITNTQIRYILAGSPTPPIAISNARFIVLGPPEPRTGEWVPFARNLRRDWLEQWGSVPRRFEFLRVLFEVRYDEAPNLPPGGMGDVFFDDLYLGPAVGAETAVPMR